jgi:septal ring factor EnvC (AmiA/AmiB activator)
MDTSPHLLSAQERAEQFKRHLEEQAHLAARLRAELRYTSEDLTKAQSQVADLAEKLDKAEAAIEEVRRFVQSHAGKDAPFVEGAVILAILDGEDEA